MFGGVLSEHRIELRDGCRRFDLGTPRKPVAGQHRAEHHADSVEFGQFAHRDDVAEDVFEFDGAVVLSDVVDTGKDHHGLRVQVDDVAAETREHLGGRLAADTPVDEAVAGEEVGIGPDPVIRNGIAHEDHFDGFTRQGGILPFVTPVLRPVAGLLGRERKRRENRQRQEYDFFHRAIRFLGFPLTKLGNPE